VRAAAVEPRTIQPAARLDGRLRLPSDKSIAHRALIANALEDGMAEVHLSRPGADVLSTIACLRALGVEIEVGRGEPMVVRITGGDWRAPSQPLDCANSGTTMRLLAGALAGRPLAATLDGDGSLRRRPMERVASPLRAMGAQVETDDGHAPLRIAGRAPLTALEHHLPVPSAQLLGAVAFAALSADGETVIHSPAPVRDHTERLLSWMGAEVRRDGLRTTVRGPIRLTARPLDVPGDTSSAAAWLVAGAIHPDAELHLEDVCLNPTRLAIVGVLRAMGAQIEVREASAHGPEPVGELTVSSGEPLRAISVSADEVPGLIDELPLLAVAMAAAEGSSELRGAAELRVKESDRIAAVVTGLAAIGAHVEELPDGWRVRRGTPRDAAITTHGDHRIAIACAVAAATAIAASVHLDDADCVAVSYPGFFEDLAAVTRMDR
jgi:3-phosphoshikimate 1-carboxyvinyltransferase